MPVSSSHWKCWVSVKKKNYTWPVFATVIVLVCGSINLTLGKLIWKEKSKTVHVINGFVARQSYQLIIPWHLWFTLRHINSVYYIISLYRVYLVYKACTKKIWSYSCILKKIVIFLIYRKHMLKIIWRNRNPPSFVPFPPSWGMQQTFSQN